ncbi:hypothetical protein CYY_001571 [Polysphondylium violaceum]|uniref:Phosphatidate cytidylyltransferase n=1 Tax=Polysphondylium violaceum TaxID=133409 RepID=A0A8J4Q327_9MYCE|nr:hypothetical protein CYY_001571 [Polysphondylium violaceum]
MLLFTKKQLTNLLRYLGIGVKRVPRVIKELRRKGFHVVGLIIPLVLYVGINYTTFFTKEVALWIMSTITLVYFIWEMLRLNIPAVKEFCMRTYGGMMREKEKDRINGSFFYLLGSTLCIYAFNPTVTIASLLFLIIGDFSAALIGLSYGKTKIGNKSLEGTCAMFLSCLLISLVLFRDCNLGEQLAFWGSLAASLVELFNPSWIDDNLTIPCFSGLAIHFMAYRLGTEIVC